VLRERSGNELGTGGLRLGGGEFERGGGGHLCASDGGDHFGAILGDAPGLVFSTDHETSNVLKENEGYPPLRAELNKMSTF
jgi:hypothetical protein